MGSVVVIGGTSGLGREVAKHYADSGHEVVLSGRNPRRAATVAEGLGGKVTGVGLDLARPHDIAGALADAGPVDHLVLAAIDRDHNSVAEYSVDRALYLVTLKLVGYTEVIHALRPRLSPEGSVLLFGGQAKERPYPGSTTVTTVNGGVVAMVKTLALELKPLRVNAIHPGIVGDSPYWSGKTEYLEGVRARTPTGRLTTMSDIVGAVVFLLENRAVNGVNLAVDGGWLLM
ncbi:MAG TPA: SDR family oxidoreductase [Pilimelia sp.]|nr:SDR family oxidoreductase [Pilimelia sp.]